MAQLTRTAQAEDSKECARLCKEALEGLDAQRGGALYARRESAALVKALSRPGGLARLLGDQRRRVLVGVLDESVVALAVGRLDTVGEAPIGVVDAIYVHPARRGRGVGRELLDSLVSWFDESHCTGVDAGALPGDRQTKNFFESTGFKARLLTMHRPLE